MQLLAEQYWWVFVIALLIGIAVAWWIFAGRRTSVDIDTGDTLDEGAGPAQRNQALIDSPPATAGGTVPEVKAATPDPVPVSPAEPAPTEVESAQPSATASASAGDDLTRIKGVGPKLQATLHDLGVTSFAQIAAWDDAEIDRIDKQLGRFEGRIRRDQWVTQAKFLADGDEDGFAAQFGATS